MSNLPTSSAKLNKYVRDLRRRRRNAGLTQEQVAASMGKCIQSVSRWENSGFKNASVANLLAYISVLEKSGVDVSMV